MKSKATNLFLCVLVITCIFAIMEPVNAGSEIIGPVNEEWVVRYDATGASDDEPNDIAVDSQGNIYVVGYSERTIEYTSKDYITIKYDPDGNELWTARYNGPVDSWDVAAAVAIDSSGNVFVTGKSLGGVGQYDYATVAYDTDGNELWSSRYNGALNREDAAYDIDVDSSGNVYVTGRSFTSTHFDITTIAYDPLGNQKWIAFYNGPGNSYDYGYDIEVAEVSGNVYIYVTGMGRGYGTYNDYETVAYDPQGNELWVARYNGPGNYYDEAWGLATDSAGNVFVTGMSSGTDAPGYEAFDYATVGYDKTGNELWVARYNSPWNSFDGAYAITTDFSGNVIVTGFSESDLAGPDYATVKYDPNGNELWVARYAGPVYNDAAWVVVADPSDNIYVTGESDGTSGELDIATLAYDASGNELWVARYDGPDSGPDVGWAMTCDESSNVYVTGWSGVPTSVPFPMWDWDIATIKYSPLTPEDVIEDLIEEILELEIPAGVKKGIINLLNNVLDAIDLGDYQTAIDQLNAFINWIEALEKAHKITEEEAAALIADAQWMIDYLSGLLSTN